MSDIPNWLEPVAQAVASSMTVHAPVSELGLRYREAEGVWDVLVYSLPVEMVGGAHDGGLAAPGFSLDLTSLLSAFARVHAFSWDAHGTSPENTEAGPCLTIQGEVTGRKVWLRVLASSPAGVEPAAKVDGNGRRQAG